MTRLPLPSLVSDCDVSHVSGVVSVLGMSDVSRVFAASGQRSPVSVRISVVTTPIPSLQVSFYRIQMIDEIHT